MREIIEEVAAQLQGYDPKALSAEQVNAFLALMVDRIGPLGSRAGDRVLLPVGQALGRVLAADVVSPVDVPPHDNSAMDGFAFEGAALGQEPLALQVVGTAFAGKAWQGTVGPGQCLRIMTGAILPTGLDTVAPQEFCQVDGNQVTIAPGLLKLGDNRRFKGEDIAKGSVALGRGTPLLPAALGLLASLGIPNVQVLRPLRVAYFSTGDEVLSLGEPPREGAVYDSNRYTVFGLLTRMGCQVLDLGVVRDEPVALKAAFLQAASQADAIITSGGVSVGEADFTKAMMRELGDVAFWRVAMRPGRPMAVGCLPKPPVATEFDEKLTVCTDEHSVDSYKNNSDSNAIEPSQQVALFGLPGNPVAVMVTFLAFVRPALLRLMGAADTAPPMLQAQCTERLRKKPGRTEYQRGIVSLNANGQLQVRTTGQQGSGVLSSMVQANGLIVLPHQSSDVNPGDVVSVMVFEGVV
jgi:molybdopterin molybdotransferase